MQNRAVCIAMLALMTACDRAPKAPPPPPEASHSWNGNQLVIQGQRSTFPTKVRVNLLKPLKSDALVLSFAVEDGAGLEAVTVDGERRSFTNSRAEFPVSDARLGLAELATNKVTLTSKVRVEIREHAPFDVQLPPLPFGVEKFFFQPRKVVFDDDVDAPGRTIFVIGNGLQLKSRVIGPGTLARDVDWLVKETRVDSGKKTCSGYRSSRGGPAVTVTALAYDSKLTVVDRRTGEVVKEETLKSGPPTCPSLSIGFRGGVTDVPVKRINAWIDALQ